MVELAQRCWRPMMKSVRKTVGNTTQPVSWAGVPPGDLVGSVDEPEGLACGS
jgi:hypothetical protein